MGKSNMDQRRAPRISVHLPVLGEKIPQSPVSLHPNLASVYDRVVSNDTDVGRRLTGTMIDLSTNGAFICGTPLPLLSRVAISFSVEDYGAIEAIGWVLWRRKSDCEIPRENGVPLKLKAGFGLLFEAIEMSARQHIALLVDRYGGV